MSKIPQIDSIQELAQFWDIHDLTEFEDDLEDDLKDNIKNIKAFLRIPAK